MGIFELKWLMMIIIFAASSLAGFASLRIANRYKKLVSLGEALASGIFIGAALFHLLPDATEAFTGHLYSSPLLDVLLVASCSFVLLMLLEQVITHRIGNYKKVLHIGPLLTTLSIHALIAGLAIGISNTYTIVISLLIAILAHKAFEMFALVINLHRNIKRNHSIRILFLLFSCITPLGIFIGTSGDKYLPFAVGDMVTAYLDAICAGTFIYIATVHSHHRHHPHSDSYQKYEEVLATIAGAFAMGILAIWL